MNDRATSHQQQRPAPRHLQPLVIHKRLALPSRPRGALSRRAVGGERPGRPREPLLGALDGLRLRHAVAQKERIFAEAKAMGASHIRLDIEMHAVFKQYHGATACIATGAEWTTWWSSRGATRCRSRRSSSACPSSSRCATARRGAVRAGRLRGLRTLRRRGRGAHARRHQPLRDPQRARLERLYRGTPEDYARMLAAAYDGIKARSPASTVLLGGVSGTIAKDWLTRVFATPGAAAATKFDIANVHVRGGLGSLTRTMTFWHDLLRFVRARQRAAVGDRARLSRRHGLSGRPPVPRWRGRAGCLPAGLPADAPAGRRRTDLREHARHAGPRSSAPAARSTARAWPTSPTTRRTRRAGARPPRSSASLASKWPKVPLTVGELARLTAARNTHAITCFRTTGAREQAGHPQSTQDRANDQEAAHRREARRPRAQAQAGERAAPPGQGLAAQPEEDEAPVRDREGRAAATCLLVTVYQGRLDAGS